jgi:hypothetical protein
MTFLQNKSSEINAPIIDRNKKRMCHDGRNFSKEEEVIQKWKCFKEEEAAIRKRQNRAMLRAAAASAIPIPVPEHGSHMPHMPFPNVWL